MDYVKFISLKLVRIIFSCLERRRAMEYLGLWKLRKMTALTKGSFRVISEDDLSSLEDNKYTKRVKMMFRSDFIISDSSLSIYYKPSDGEPILPEDEGKEMTERGILLDSFPLRIEGEAIMIDYGKRGDGFFPVFTDDDGYLSISGGILKIQKV